MLTHRLSIPLSLEGKNFNFLALVSATQHIENWAESRKQEYLEPRFHLPKP